MNPARPGVLTNAFYAFYDLHRPAYHAYAAAYLTPEEAQIAVAQLFDLVAGTWTTVVAERHPSAWAWQQLTRVVAHRSGRTLTAVEDASLLHDELLLSITQIATVTGTEPATVTTLLATARRKRTPEQSTLPAFPSQAHNAVRNPAVKPPPPLHRLSGIGPAAIRGVGLLRSDVAPA
ncbi:hypothetical protein AB0K86_19670 [Streptomyces clavifer]|uniref:hypothetical protein n=1 Tax=Streptomyces TaxID=1883 RepID=UPI0007C8669C|nr:hypothetical protein [Streptomyces sp. Root55]